MLSVERWANVARPPLAEERLSVNERTGKVIYGFRRPFRDGSTHVVLDPMSFLSRLAALVPAPRMHLVTYHGVLAPSSGTPSGGVDGTRGRN